MGSHYHSETGTANKVVRGRYGSRSADTGRVDETVYTAGPRGYVRQSNTRTRLNASNATAIATQIRTFAMVRILNDQIT